MKSHRYSHRSLLMAALVGLTMSAAGTASPENPSGTSAPTDAEKQAKADADAAAKAQKAEAAEAKKKEKEEKAAKAAQEKADKAAAKKEADDKKKADAAAKVDADKKAKADADAAAKQAKIDAKAKKEQDKADAKAAKEANRMPEQNGVRRPKPEGLCGRVWTLADEMTQETGSTVPVAALITRGVNAGLNEGNIKTEYARWRKFNGISGRVVAATPAPAASTTDGAGAPAQ